MLNFFLGQEHLTAFEWVLRAAVAFVFLIIVAKLLGQRAISQLRLLDFSIALVIGNVIAHPLSDEHRGLKGSLISTVVLTVLYIAGVFLLRKWPWFRKLVNHAPITVVEDGKILYRGLAKSRISIDVLLEEMREKGIEDLKKVALAIWEADGKLSFFLDLQYQPITPSSAGLRTEPFFMPLTIIKEGKFIQESLRKSGRDEEWVSSRLQQAHQAEAKDVLLATLGKEDELQVFLYR